MIDKIKFYQKPERFFIQGFLLLLLLQFLFWMKTEHIKPDIYVVPPVPNKYSIEALSLGDNEFYFRVLALKIQNAGDSFGRFTALKKYDYHKLYQWFTLLDTLNDQSTLIPALASYYYSQTQHKEDNRHIIRYLEEHSEKDIDRNWWWMYQAVTIARDDVRDQQLALRLAYKLSANNASNAPFWTKQYPAFLSVNMGEDCQAFAVISQLLQDNENGIRKISAEEMGFMRYFIKTRLGKLKHQRFDPRKCKQQDVKTSAKNANSG